MSSVYDNLTTPPYSLIALKVEASMHHLYGYLRAIKIFLAFCVTIHQAVSEHAWLGRTEWQSLLCNQTESSNGNGISKCTGVILV